MCGLLLLLRLRLRLRLLLTLLLLLLLHPDHAHTTRATGQWTRGRGGQLLGLLLLLTSLVSIPGELHLLLLLMRRVLLLLGRALLPLGLLRRSTGCLGCGRRAPRGSRASFNRKVGTVT